MKDGAMELQQLGKEKRQSPKSHTHSPKSPTSQTTPPFPIFKVMAASMNCFTSDVIRTNLYPYMGPLVLWYSKSGNLESAGYDASILVASFMLGRSLASFPAGMLADQIGRKRVLQISISLVALFQLLFSFTKTFWWAVCFYFFMGMVNCISPVSKTWISEFIPVSENAQQQRAMGILSSVFAVSACFGPLLGGLTAGLTTGWKALDAFPFALPNLVCFCLLLMNLFVTQFLPETLNIRGRDRKFKYHKVKPKYDSEDEDEGEKFESKEEEKSESKDDEGKKNETTQNDKGKSLKGKENKANSHSNKANSPSENANPMNITKNNEPPNNGSFFNLLRSMMQTDILWACAGYSLLCFTSIYFNETFNLFMVAPLETGGLGLSTSAIGYIQGVGAAICVTFQVYRLRRDDKKSSSPISKLIFIMLLEIPLYVSVPLLHNIMRLLPKDSLHEGTSNMTSLHAGSTSLYPGNTTSGNTTPIMQYTNDWTLISAMVVIVAMYGTKQLLTINAFGYAYILVNNSCKTDKRGAVNGFGFAMGGFIKMFGPLIGGSLLAWSLTKGRTLGVWFLSYPLSFFVLTTLKAFSAILLHSYLPRSLNEGKSE